MMEEPSSVNEHLTALASQKIEDGENLIESLHRFEYIEGCQKLQRKIRQEIKFLLKVIRNHKLKKEHLQCSNLTHFSALLSTLQTIEKCTSVNKAFMLNDRKVVVDIVCDSGLTWIKVVARNPKSISQISMGCAGYGVRSILDQAEEYVECAKLYPCLFQTPKLIFVFANGIGTNLAVKLESYGIVVQGTRIDDLGIYEDFDDDSDITSDVPPAKPIPSPDDLTTKNISHIKKVNLDVSAMLAYCSSVTNGSADLYDFSVPVLAQQAKWERERPQKLILDEFFKGKRLYCCKTAMDNFVNIVNTVGGPSEQIRAKEFMDSITVLPDNATAEDTPEKDDDTVNVFNSVQFSPDKTLSVGGKIRERSLVIFTFGDRIRAVTVTANDGFVRAAKQQGINFVVLVHESRALTEQKEQLKAIPKQT